MANFDLAVEFCMTKLGGEWREEGVVTEWVSNEYRITVNTYGLVLADYFVLLKPNNLVLLNSLLDDAILAKPAKLATQAELVLSLGGEITAINYKFPQAILRIGAFWSERSLFLAAEK